MTTLSVTASVAFAGSRYSLPLEGYYHPGRAMPLRIEPRDSATTIFFKDGLPIDVAASVGGVALLLTLGDQVRDATGQPLNALEPDQKLVACDASLEKFTATLFPDARIVHIDPPTLSGPAIAWESLDGWLSDRQPPESIDAAALFAQGMTFAVHSDARPTRNLPWRRAGELWIARPIAPPIEMLSASAYLPTESWRLELSSAERARLLGVTSLVFLISLASVLYGGRGRSILIAGTIGGCIVAVLIWRSRLNPARSVGGSILVEQGDVEQNDHWTYWRCARPAVLQVADRPLPIDAEHAAALNLREAFRADGGFEWRCDLNENMTLATLRRQFASTRFTPGPSAKPSPLAPLARLSYVGESSSVQSSTDQNWPDVVVRKP